MVPQSWSGQSVSSSSSAGASLLRSSPVCAKIHSCSLKVPASPLSEAPGGSCSSALTTHSSVSLGVAAPGVHLVEQAQTQWNPQFSSCTVKVSVPDPETGRQTERWTARDSVCFLQTWNPRQAFSRKEGASGVHHLPVRSEACAV